MSKKIAIPIIKSSKRETKVVPLNISKLQKKFLSKVWLFRQYPASKLVYEGIKACGPIRKLSESQGPFSEPISLNIPIEFIDQLDDLANENGVSRAEIIRRIIDEAKRLWIEEEENLRKVKRPFSTAYEKIPIDDD